MVFGAIRQVIGGKESKTISCGNIITDLIKMTLMKIYLDNITSLLQPLISLLVLITNIIFCLLHILL